MTVISSISGMSEKRNTQRNLFFDRSDRLNFKFLNFSVSIEFFPSFSATYAGNLRSLKAVQKHAPPRVNKCYKLSINNEVIF